MIKYAIILAGGKGERLRPLTNDRPKPMVEVNGKPILLYQIENLINIGVETIVLSCGYKAEVIQEYFGDGSKFGFKALYAVEETPLGRGGGIKKAMKQLPEDWQECYILNGDILTRINLKQLAIQHAKTGAEVTVSVVPLRSPYGIVDFNEQDQILGFKEKPELPYWLNAGMYVFSERVFDMLPDIGDHETETFPRLKKEEFYVYKSNAYWRGIDTVKDHTEAEKEVAQIFN